MLTAGSITTETFSAALLGLEDLSLWVTAAALHVAANPEKHPRLRLMLAALSEVMQCCEEHEERGEHLITDLRRNRENRRNN